MYYNGQDTFGSTVMSHILDHERQNSPHLSTPLLGDKKVEKMSYSIGEDDDQRVGDHSLPSHIEINGRKNSNNAMQTIAGVAGNVLEW